MFGKVWKRFYKVRFPIFSPNFRPCLVEEVGVELALGVDVVQELVSPWRGPIALCDDISIAGTRKVHAFLTLALPKESAKELVIFLWVKGNHLHPFKAPDTKFDHTRADFPVLQYTGVAHAAGDVTLFIAL